MVFPGTKSGRIACLASIKSDRRPPDMPMMKVRRRNARFVGASVLVFATGPAAMLAVPWLQRAHLIADTPLWLLVVLLLGCSAANALAQAIEPRVSARTALHLRTATASLSTGWVVYATGWGSLLVIGYAIGVADAMRVHGGRAWRPGLFWSGVAIASGEGAVAIGLAPTVLRPAVAHSVAATSFVCLALLIRTLGSSTEAAERATERVEQGRSYFRDLVQHAADVIALVDPELRIEYISPGIEPLVGCSPSSCIGLGIGDVLGTDASEDIVRAYDSLTLSDYVSCEWHLTNELGEQRRAFARLTRRSDGSLVLNLRDVTEQRALEAQLVQRANVDTLTGLPNRSALSHQLHARPSLENVTVLFVDLDGFKEVNDSLGHEHGDVVLRKVADRIASAVPGGVTVGRLGGDEFLAVIDDGNEGRAASIAADIVSAVEALGAAEGRLPLSASVGIANGAANETAEELLRRADEAMYRAKASGPGHAEFASMSHGSPAGVSWSEHHG